ncbi:polar amino acid transport system substrate-binding protein [Colwellia chukchiensis]|uniref:Polar amino acid transport system substrate-binding protein n=1 Tax=Colwellia chukchiensis TaxID=641665 RepID=A0A1H7R5G5_9GAMM|nr:polar amino acid transport system substrate-binding protein [Colwellia chukchiensis]
MLHEIKRLKLNNIIHAGHQGKKTELYIAIANAKAARLQGILNSGIRDFRRSGKLKPLLTKYGLNDWQ